MSRPHDLPRLTGAYPAAWQAFAEVPWRWVVLGLATGGAAVAVWVVALVATGDPARWFAEDASAWELAVLAPDVAVDIVTVLLTVVLGGAALHQMRTATFSASAGWRLLSRPDVWVLAVVMGVATAVLDAPTAGVAGLLLVPLQLYPPFLLADGRGAVAAVRDGLRLLCVRPGQQVLLLLIAAVAAVAGVLACGVGLLVAGPVVTLAYAWAYCHLTRRTTGPVDATR